MLILANQYRGVTMSEKWGGAGGRWGGSISMRTHLERSNRRIKAGETNV